MDTQQYKVPRRETVFRSAKSGRMIKEIGKAIAGSRLLLIHIELNYLIAATPLLIPESKGIC